MVRVVSNKVKIFDFVTLLGSRLLRLTIIYFDEMAASKNIDMCISTHIRWPFHFIAVVGCASGHQQHNPWPYD